MKKPSINSKEDYTSALKALEQAKYELALFEQSRPHRLAKAINILRQNPLKFIKNFHEIPKVFRRLPRPPVPNLSESALEHLHFPLSLHARVNTLVYPRLKVGVIGDISELGTVCHAFKAGDSNWTKMLEFGVDFLVIYLSSFDLERHRLSLEQAKQYQIKTLLIKDIVRKIPENLLEKVDKVVSQFEDEYQSDKVFVDITKHNPITLTIKPGSVYTTQKDAGHNNVHPALAKLKFLKPNDIIYTPNGARLSYTQQKRIAQAAARGVIVVSDAKWLGYEITPHNNKDVWLFIDSLNGNLELKSRLGVRQRREVILNFSQIQRLEYLISLLDPNFKPFKPLVSIILSSRRPDYMEAILKQIAALHQTTINIEVLFIAHGNNFDVTKTKRQLEYYKFPFQFFARKEETIFGDNLNLALSHARGEFVTKFDDDDLYGPSHLEDNLAAFYYSGANMVGKWSHWIYFESSDSCLTWVPDKQESYVIHLPGGTFLCKRTFLDSVGGFGKVHRGIDSELYRRIRARGAILYSSHKYNYVRVRHGDEHTYDVSDEDFKSQCSPPEIKGQDFETLFS